MSDDPKPDSPGGNVVTFRRLVPSLTRKHPPEGSLRAFCEHARLGIHMMEPLIECDDCGAIVDPYAWLRRWQGKFDQMEDEAKSRLHRIEQQIAKARKRQAMMKAGGDDDNRALAEVPPQRRSEKF